MMEIFIVFNYNASYFRQGDVHLQAYIRRATQSLLKIRKSYNRFLKQRLKAFEARRRRAGGGAGGLVRPGGG